MIFKELINSIGFWQKAFLLTLMVSCIQSVRIGWYKSDFNSLKDENKLLENYIEELEYEKIRRNIK